MTARKTTSSTRLPVPTRARSFARPRVGTSLRGTQPQGLPAAGEYAVPVAPAFALLAGVGLFGQRANAARVPNASLVQTER